MNYLNILLTILITSVACKPKTTKVISEEKKANHTNRHQNTVNTLALGFA